MQYLHQVDRTDQVSSSQTWVITLSIIYFFNKITHHTTSHHQQDGAWRSFTQKTSQNAYESQILEQRKLHNKKRSRDLSISKPFLVVNNM